MKILSVDDSKSVRNTVRNMVEVLGIEMIEAVNGEEAFTLLEEIDGKVDLILLDWEMPVMNGYNFLKRVKSDDRFSAIPIIMLSAVSQKDKMIDAIRSGAKQYLTKPFSSEDLLTKIIQTLGLDSLEEL